MALPAWIKATRQTTVVPSPGAPLLDVSGNKATPPSPAHKPQFKFSMECQLASQWCWAAVAVSVARHYSPACTAKQCTLAGKVLCTTCCSGSEKCLANDRPSDCDRPYVVYHPLGEVGHLSEIRTAPIGLATAPDTVTIQGEVDGRRPVICRIGWKKKGGHFVVLHGYDMSGATPLVHVADPINDQNGTSIYSLREFTEAYRNGDGTWTHTYTTRP